MKSFLFLLTLQLSFVSTFFTSNFAFAVNQNNVPTNSNQTTINLNKSQFQELTDSINNTKQESINIKTTDGKAFIIKIQEDPKGFYSKNASVINLLIGAFIGAVFTFIISLIQDEINKQKQRISNTFELAKDWDSQVMRESRTLAWKVFSNNRKLNDKDFAFYYESSCEKEINYAISMLRIVDFFDRVSFLANKDYINKVLAQTIFHKAYKTWYDDCFKVQDKLLNPNGGSDENQDVKKTFRNIGDLTWLYNQSEKDWTTEILNPLLHKIFGKPMDIHRHEQTKLNEYINEFSSSLYRQLYNEDQPEKVKASTEIRKKIAKGKQLQYTIDVSFPNPTEEGQ